jgi:hypothetical protein
MDPPSLPNTAHSWHGQPVAFGEAVTYHCQNGYFFEDNRERLTAPVYCLGDGSWDSEAMPQCIQSEGILKTIMLHKATIAFSFLYFQLCCVTLTPCQHPLVGQGTGLALRNMVPEQITRVATTPTSLMAL